MFDIALRSFEWTFIKKPLRRYETPKHDQNALIERPISVTNVLLDALDLLTNVRGIGWSWSPNPFPRESIPPPSTTAVLFKMLLRLVVFDASHCIIQYICPAVNDSKGGSIFDPSLPLLPRAALTSFCCIWYGVWTYAMIDSSYHCAILVGRVVFRQPASAWPPIFHRPLMSTSLQEFWSVRWHQLGRHIFIVFGARPVGKLFGRPGALMGGFAVSAVLHHVALWGLGNGSDNVTVRGFFLLMGVGTVVEETFTRATGLRVRGWLGWLWMMAWMTLWGTFMLDGWARHGMMASEFIPVGPRPGKIVVDTIIALSKLATVA